MVYVSQTRGKIGHKGNPMNDWREQWREANRAHWDERVPIHVSGEFYDVAGFKAGREPLRPFEISETTMAGLATRIATEIAAYTYCFSTSTERWVVSKAASRSCGHENPATLIL
jgi:hypothetical protein